MINEYVPHNENPIKTYRWGAEGLKYSSEFKGEMIVSDYRGDVLNAFSNGVNGYNAYETKNPDIFSIVQSSNLYVYCINNPLKYTDPSGQTGVAVDMLRHALFGNGEFQDYSYNSMYLITFNSPVILNNMIQEKLEEFKKTGLQKKYRLW